MYIRYCKKNKNSVHYLEQKYYSMYNGEFNKQKFIEFLLICFPGCNNFKDINKE